MLTGDFFKTLQLVPSLWITKRGKRLGTGEGKNGVRSKGRFSEQKKSSNFVDGSLKKQIIKFGGEESGGRP